MKAAILIIGDEILLGRVTDTNSGFIARTLEPMGIAIDRVLTVGDDGTAIASAVRCLTDRYPLVITTGGLGPTKDDITKRVLCDIFGGSLVFDAEVMEDVQALFSRRGLQMNRLTRTQAMVPDSCRVIRNKLGTAPIMWFEDARGHVLISMPGVPFETSGMMRMTVAGEIARRFAPDVHFAHRTLQTTGMSESALAEMLAGWEEALPTAFHLAYLPDSPVIKLRLDGHGTDAGAVEEEADRLYGRLKELCSDIAFAEGEATVAATLIDLLRSRALSVATAESCTGGNIGHRITEIPGSSDVYAGGVISYSNEVKHNVLGVHTAALAEYGAVSRPVVEQMLAGVASLMNTGCAMATSGIAGPGGGTPEKPVGTVWIGACTPSASDVRLFHLPGDRARVIERATVQAMLMLIKLLR